MFKYRIVLKLHGVYAASVASTVTERKNVRELLRELSVSCKKINHSRYALVI